MVLKCAEVFINSQLMGILKLHKGNRLSFEYDLAYASHPHSIPLSFSMPLTQQRHGDTRVRNFLWGLFPDNDAVLRQWGRELQVTLSHPFDLAVSIGHDFAGALHFGDPAQATSGMRCLTQSELIELLDGLVRNPARSRAEFTQGRFSLAGAQAKTALRKIGSNWYLPWGREATTHILKPMVASHPEGYAYNEHYCHTLARKIGLHTALSQVEVIGQHTVFISQRYDRFLLPEGKIVRLHQEDLCQALSVHPSEKYESEGGPGIVQIMQLLLSAKDGRAARAAFMDAILFNYLILGTDAHAKNYGLIYGRNGDFSLAPLYDVSSFLPYLSQNKDQRFAMRIGRHYKDRSILKGNFTTLCKQCHYPAAQFWAQANRMLLNFESAMPEVESLLREQKSWNTLLMTLSEALKHRLQIARQLFSS